MGQVLKQWCLYFVFILVFACCTPVAAARTLYYLNIPETINKAGSIVPFELSPNDEFRLFFHYHNGTSKPLTLYIHTSEPLQIELETYCIDANPEMAGLIAAKQYFDKTNKVIVNQKISLPAHQTISGMIDGTTKKSITVHVGFNDSDSLSIMSKSKVIIEPCSVREYTIDVTKTKWTQITLGGDHESRIPGCYGVLYKIKVISSKAKKVEVFMSGRGGTVRVPYVIDSKLHVTSTLAPRKFYPIFELNLKPNEPLEFSTLPVGGYSYPLMIVFKS